MTTKSGRQPNQTLLVGFSASAFEVGKDCFVWLHISDPKLTKADLTWNNCKKMNLSTQQPDVQTGEPADDRSLQGANFTWSQGGKEGLQNLSWFPARAPCVTIHSERIPSHWLIATVPHMLKLSEAQSAHEPTRQPRQDQNPEMKLSVP